MKNYTTKSLFEHDYDYPWYRPGYKPQHTCKYPYRFPYHSSYPTYTVDMRQHGPCGRCGGKPCTCPFMQMHDGLLTMSKCVRAILLAVAIYWIVRKSY